ncbi:MAG: OmpA family protein, partial [Chitinophagaceae bacterium]
MKQLLFLSFLMLVSFLCFSQGAPARARKAFEKAQRYQAIRNWPKAEQEINKALKEYRGYTEAYQAYGQWLMDRNEFAAAAKILKEGEALCPKGKEIFAKQLARCLMVAGDENGALAQIPANTRDSFWKKLEQQALFIQKQKAKFPFAHPLTPVGPLWGINTPDAEMFPTISGDGKTFYFTRRVNGQDEDFFFAKPDTCGGWQSARNMGSPPNTLEQESAQFISADGHYLFFQRCGNRTLSGWDQGGCDLFMSYTADSVWSIAQSFGGTINTPDFDGMPSLSSDNRELYFVSNRPGGYGGLDIWSSRFEHGLWQMPRNLGPEINTAGDETAPFIYADNSTLYFASTGWPGMGGSDIFMSRKTGDTTWSKTENMGIPINSVFDEASLSLNTAGDTAYLASNRDSLADNFDLYQCPLPSIFKPLQVMTMKGSVYDSLEGKRLNYSNIYITDSNTKKELYQVVSNRGDGSYTISLPVGHAYFLYTDRIGYQSRNDTVRCDADSAGKNIEKSFALLPFGYQAPTKDSLVARVYFARNSTVLTDSATQVIIATMAVWKGVPGVTVFVNGYTDNTGTPMLNEQLSFTRARLVGSIITQQGWNADIVNSQGWGEANTLVDNETEEHRNMNRR